LPAASAQRRRACLVRRYENFNVRRRPKRARIFLATHEIVGVYLAISFPLLIQNYVAAAALLHNLNLNVQ
jgi:hypothetical protein